MNIKTKLSYLLFCAAVIAFILSSLLFYYVGPKSIIQDLGITNSYAIGFVMGILGGSSIFFSAILYVLVFVIVKGGLDPILLGIIVGFGITIGDSLFYFLGSHGRKIAQGKFKVRLDNFEIWLGKQSLISVIVIVFVYVAFTPFPNSLMMISTGLANYRYRLIFPITLVGNIFFITFVGMLASNTRSYLILLVPAVVIILTLLIVDRVRRRK